MDLESLHKCSQEEEHFQGNEVEFRQGNLWVMEERDLRALCNICKKIIICPHFCSYCMFLENMDKFEIIAFPVIQLKFVSKKKKKLIQQILE